MSSDVIFFFCASSSADFSFLASSCLCINLSLCHLTCVASCLARSGAVVGGDEEAGAGLLVSGWIPSWRVPGGKPSLTALAT